MMQPPFLIYLVDDDEDDLLFIHTAFRELGLENVCKGFLSGSELLQHLRFTNGHERPDVIILDFDMPRMSGKDILLHLRSLPEMQDVPVVFYSDKINLDIEEVLVSLGARGCIKKGVNAHEQLQFAKDIAVLLKK
jgi:chemotaxis family two-component system response regulator Rcp1